MANGLQKIYLLVASEVIAMRQPGFIFTLVSIIVSPMLAANIAAILINADMYQETSQASGSYHNLPAPLKTYRWFDNCPAINGVPTKQCNSRTGMIPNGSMCFVQSVKDAFSYENQLIMNRFYIFIHFSL